MKIKLLRKIVSFVASFSLLFNSVSAPISVLAQEASPTPTPDATAIPSSDPTVSPSPEVSPEVSPTPTEIASPEPTLELTSTPTTEVSPAPTDESPVLSSETDGPTTTDPPTPTATTENQTQEEHGILSAIVLENTEASSVDSLDLSIETDGSATLVTDKADYAPTDTVLITGAGFTANETYTIEITSQDAPAVNFVDSVVADADGKVVYSYQLDGNYRPNYSVFLKDGEVVVASTTFTDSPISGCTNDTAGANDEPGQKDLTKMCVSYSGLPTSITVDWNWDEKGPGGNVGGNTGDACSLYDTDGDGLVNYSLCVIIDGDPSTYQSKALYSCSDAKSDRCTNPTPIASGSVTSSCTANTQNTDPFPAGAFYPTDSVATCTVNLSDVGGAGVAELVDVCSYPSQEPNSDPSDCIVFRDNTGRLEVIKDLIPSTDSGKFNLQINGVTEAADQGDGGTTGEKVVNVGTPTVGETAGTGTSLSNYSSSISCRDLNGSGSVVASGSSSGPLNVPVSEGDDIVCTITNSLTQGTLRVIKNVVNDNGGNLTASNFTLHVKSGVTDVTGSPAAGSATGTVYSLTSGSYVVSENTPPTGYSQTGFSGDCDSNGNVTVVAGVEKTCTITNNDIQPLLTVTKVVINDNGGTKQVADFPLFVNATGVVSGVQNGFNAGSYTVSETNQTGYTAVISGDCAANGSITLSAGDVKSCTVTNNDVAPTLTLVKTVVNNNGGNNVVSDFELRIDGGLVTSGVANTVSAGFHTATEVTLPGYSASAWGGDCAANGTITLNPGDAKTCTITNDDVSPSITLIKNVTNNDGGTAGANDFGLTIGGTPVTSGQTLNVNANTPFALNEAGLAGYSFVSMTGTSCPTQLGGTVTLSEGQNVTCTITNDDQAAHLVVVKHVTNDNGGTAVASSFTMTINGVTAVGGNSFPGAEAPGVDKTLSSVGSYNVTESGPLGYSASFSADCAGTIALGQTKTCTVTNNDQAATLIVIKHVINDNGGTAVASNFNLDSGGSNDTPDNFAGNELGTTVTLDAGNFNVNESGPSGYSASFSVDCAGTIANGETKTCTVTNDDIAPILHLRKVLVNGQEGTAQLTDFTLTANGVGANDLSGTSPVDSDGSLKADTFALSESGPTGYSPSSWVCVGGSQNGSNITLGIAQEATCTITNTKFSALGDFIWRDDNGDGVQDPGEPGITGVVVNLYLDDGDNVFEPGAGDTFVGTETSDGTGGLYLFENLLPGNYWVVVDESTLPAGYSNTYGPTQPITLAAGVTYWMADFGYVPPKKVIEISKSNNKGSVGQNDTITYTLTVKNTGNVTLYDVHVTDALPGGFTYLSGTTSGDWASDPVVSGSTLTWNTTLDLGPDESFTFTYQVKTPSDLGEGTYKNLATCTAIYSTDRQTSENNLANSTVGEEVNCNVADSSVSYGQGRTYGGNLNPQVLGASTELPASGSDTMILLFAGILAALGVSFKVLSRRKNSVKN